eukprot:5218273-Prymnesium_polylepis.1
MGGSDFSSDRIWKLGFHFHAAPFGTRSPVTCMPLSCLVQLQAHTVHRTARRSRSSVSSLLGARRQICFQ